MRACRSDRPTGTSNAIRTGTLLREADLVVVRFGEQYKQWNAAFDASSAGVVASGVIAAQA